MTKIARIAKKDFADDPSDTNRQRWIKFSTTFLCPALSFTGQNPGVVNEVWDLLKQFDTATRFTIYDEWQVKAGMKPTFRQLYKKVNTAISKELNKVTTTNVKESGRKIAKISYSNPGVVFKNIITRLIGYPNMIDALVESSKYITLLGYDVLKERRVMVCLRKVGSPICRCLLAELISDTPCWIQHQSFNSPRTSFCNHPVSSTCSTFLSKWSNGWAV